MHYLPVKCWAVFRFWNSLQRFHHLEYSVSSLWHYFEGGGAFEVRTWMAELGHQEYISELYIHPWYQLVPSVTSSPKCKQLSQAPATIKGDTQDDRVASLIQWASDLSSLMLFLSSVFDHNDAKVHNTSTKIILRFKRKNTRLQILSAEVAHPLCPCPWAKRKYLLQCKCTGGNHFHNLPSP